MNALENNGWLEKFEIVREKSFYPYYADFAFENVKVVVEIDGSQHELKERKQNDIKKDKVIISSGWRIYRVSASRVLSNIENILIELKNFIGKIEIKSQTSKIVTNAEIKKENYNKKILINKENKIKKHNNLINERKNELDNSGINFNERGWIQKVSILWNVSYTQVRRFILKFIPEYHKYMKINMLPSTS